MIKPTLLTLFAATTLAGSPAWSDWVLEPERSHLAFVSIKSRDVAEVHRFPEIAGQVSDDGLVELELALDRVETLIPIRNQRMREILFKTTDYQTATVTAKIDPEVLAQMQVGDIGELVGEARLSLHGQTQPLTMHVQVAKVAPDVLMVASKQPLIVEADKFGLSDGVEQLREIAGLASISHAVPVTFVLTMVRRDAPAPAADPAPDRD